MCWGEEVRRCFGEVSIKARKEKEGVGEAVSGYRGAGRAGAASGDGRAACESARQPWRRRRGAVAWQREGRKSRGWSSAATRARLAKAANKGSVREGRRQGRREEGEGCMGSVRPKSMEEQEGRRLATVAVGLLPTGSSISWRSCGGFWLQGRWQRLATVGWKGGRPSAMAHEGGRRRTSRAKKGRPWWAACMGTRRGRGSVRGASLGCMREGQGAARPVCERRRGGLEALLLRKVVQRGLHGGRDLRRGCEESVSKAMARRGVRAAVSAEGELREELKARDGAWRRRREEHAAREESAGARRPA